MSIVVDAMGGDNAPQAIVEGAIDAIKEFGVHITFIGIEDRIAEELLKYDFDKEKVSVIHAPEIVDMKDPATVTLRKKKDSSISKGINLLKEDGFDAFVSAGNTGAVVAAATINLGMMKGVDRPAIGLFIPSLTGFSFLIDAGANTDPKSQHLLQSAKLARAYVRDVMNVEEPTVGLLNIGEEASKGTGFGKETYKLMEKEVQGFIGNLEANEVYKGKCDCIVCDGYVGNIVIKVSAGLMESAGKLMKREMKKSPLAMLGALLMKRKLKHIKKYSDYAEYGGAPLLGLNGLVMISHGRSSPYAIKNAIKATLREIEINILDTLSKSVKE